ncbi:MULTISPECIES: alpha/beta fold hydrolase [unclassified Streptomyces]|uniref:esterase/lipase family protein n=1 Tax=unclassified Streptomyces TaxID=2593676 RepID=UPI000DC79ACE|nr:MULTISPECIES: alpha/beta fold hydrolase [unclassified Streptomyces]AWZ04243.1 hypothetical protein DRB89_05920 [Streptomyces sp. ICC4]AWZ11853.1 hypothetical protein DRB96_05455 [Streptomyces sp. ICC1]
MTQAAREELGVVFVHGFKSSPDTWNHFLRLIDSDPDPSFVAPKTFRYATRLWSFNPLRRIPDFDDVADSLKGFLESETSDVRDLVLVAHSQGSLNVQRYLALMVTEGRRMELRRIRRIVMLATPNSGSAFLVTLRRSWLRKNPQVEQLNPLVSQINQTRRVVNTQIVHAPLVADRIPMTAYAGEEDGIVVAASAYGPFTDIGVLPGDHFGILRPDSPRHRSYLALKRAFQAAAADAPPVERVRTVSAAALGVHAALPPGASVGPVHRGRRGPRTPIRQRLAARPTQAVGPTRLPGRACRDTPPPPGSSSAGSTARSTRTAQGPSGSPGTWTSLTRTASPDCSWPSVRPVRTGRPPHCSRGILSPTRT